MYEMMAQRRPFDRSKGDVKLRYNICSARYKALEGVPYMCEAYSDELRRTVAILLQPSQESRPSASQLLHSPYFAQALHELRTGLWASTENGRMSIEEVRRYDHCLWADGLLTAPPQSHTPRAMKAAFDTSKASDREASRGVMVLLLQFVEAQECRERATAIIDPFFHGLKLLKRSLLMITAHPRARIAPPFRLSMPVSSSENPVYANGAPARAATVLSTADAERRRSRDVTATPEPRAAGDAIAEPERVGRSRLGERLRAAREADGSATREREADPDSSSVAARTATDGPGSSATLPGAPVRRIRELQHALHPTHH
uniref:Protein kinase domain-containing protein n=1 Tax=Neobodo designis TaxID=312471 RepID=A0A7S1W8Y8_NEODS